MQLPPPADGCESLELPNEVAEESEKFEAAENGRSTELPVIMDHSFESPLSVEYVVTCEAGVRGGDMSLR